MAHVHKSVLRKQYVNFIMRGDTKSFAKADRIAQRLGAHAFSTLIGCTCKCHVTGDAGTCRECASVIAQNREALASPFA